MKITPSCRTMELERQVLQINEFLDSFDIRGVNRTEATVRIFNMGDNPSFRSGPVCAASRQLYGAMQECGHGRADPAGLMQGERRVARRYHHQHARLPRPRHQCEAERQAHLQVMRRVALGPRRLEGDIGKGGLLGVGVHGEHGLVGKHHLVIFAEPVETIRQHPAIGADLADLDIVPVLH